MCARNDAIKKIAWIRSMGNYADPLSSHALLERIAAVKATDVSEVCEDLRGEAVYARDAAIYRMRQLLPVAAEREAAAARMEDVHSEISARLVELGLAEGVASMVVKEIAGGMVPHLSITY